ncbi:hypothetical protein K0M31_010722 [Melipona bicolor]|uniref:Uncharacterized protein n=1 Tax=Melipona bicolor TaxID=60889 RepID=A0AA40FL55_9HYME|nr:hypothetical protein K0M31_010722 [Melipona bicolor]
MKVTKIHRGATGNPCQTGVAFNVLKHAVKNDEYRIWIYDTWQLFYGSIGKKLEKHEMTPWSHAIAPSIGIPHTSHIVVLQKDRHRRYQKNWI